MFVDKLRVSLTLTVSSGAHDVPAGAIDHVAIEAHTWGFDAEVAFFVSSEDEDDVIFTDFIATSLTKAELSVGSHLVDEDDSGVPLVVTGYVLEKRMSETVSEDQSGAPIVGRRYWLRFVDAARAFWTQHRPLDLRAAGTMSDVITSYETEGVKVTQDLQALGNSLAVLCIGLPATGRASFYDFLHWYLDRTGGLLELDYGTFQYRIGGEKTRGDEATPVLSDDVTSLRILAPEPRRSATHVLDAAALIASNTAIPSPDAITGVRSDILLRTPFQSDIDGRKQIELDRLRAPHHGVEIDFLRVPLAFVPPGSLVDMGEGFPDTILAFEKTYRVTDISFRADADNPDSESDLEDKLAPFHASLVVRTELQTDPTPRRPPFLRPTYPVLAEGRVVSVGGEPTDRTWLAVPDEETGIIYLSVEVPLWNQVLVIPFEPNLAPGHFFFPPYKHQRVLLEIGFDYARIRSFLDWAPNARVPLTTQGNKLAMGKQDSNGTSLSHVFTDDKPVMRLERKLAGDIEWMELSEGVIHMEVKEIPGSPVTEPRYDVTLQVEGAKADISSGVKGAIGDITTSFGTAAGSVNASIDGATEQIGGAVDAAEATLFGKIEAALASLTAVVASAAGAVAQVSAAVGEAKSAILGELLS
jgi:hypothetical protein